MKRAVARCAVALNLDGSDGRPRVGGRVRDREGRGPMASQWWRGAGRDDVAGAPQEDRDAMTSERKPDPNCPECGGSGVATIHRSLMDREEEMSVPCPRCMAGPKRDRGEEPAE